MNEPLPAVLAGKYRVVRQLGQGGMGAVYEAVDAQGQHVAVKVIVTELAQNKTLMGRFAREAKAATAIDTPHIVKTIDAGTDPDSGTPYLVMELLRGEDLDQLIRRLGPLPQEVSLRIAAQACIALEKAHEQRILHRDMKPANLFLAEQGPARLVKLLDFGVAKVKPEVTRSSAETAGLTRTGSMLGSPLYMSPEQARGYKDIDFRSDLWALGVVLYKMLAGRTPHADTEELGELIILICTEAPEPIQDIAPWVTPHVAWVVHKALRLNPAERFGSASEMYAALMALLPAGNALSSEMLHPISAAEKGTIAPRLQTDLKDAPPPRKTSRSETSGAGISGSNPIVQSPGYGVSPSNPGVQSPGYGVSPSGLGVSSSPGLSQSGPGVSQSGPGVSWGAGGATAHAATVATLDPRAVSAPGGISIASAVAGPAPSNASGTFGATVSPQDSARMPMSAQTPGRSIVPFIGAGVLAAALIGGVLYFRSTRAADPEVQASPAESAKTKPMSVKVVVLPASAKVEVEGKETPLTDGLLEITGIPGSVHKVRVSVGETSKLAEVVITENGASPPKIEVPTAAEPAGSTTDKPVATARPSVAPGKAKPQGTGTSVFRGNR